jgi:predicted oxidoreductase (fatty acid repression mutant protein)
MSSAYLSAVKARRTIYTLKKESTIDDKKIEKIISQAVLHTPSSFNSQSTRVVILLKEEHNMLWDIAKDALKAVVSAEQYTATEQKLNKFQGAYGTVSCLFRFSTYTTCLLTHATLYYINSTT